jgi:hypothetical protein
MADKQVQTECSVETLLNTANSNKPSVCGKCAELGTTALTGFE